MQKKNKNKNKKGRRERERERVPDGEIEAWDSRPPHKKMLPVPLLLAVADEMFE